jgi:hypothetical protein
MRKPSLKSIGDLKNAFPKSAVHRRRPLASVFSRRRFIRGTAGAVGGVAGVSMLNPLAVLARQDENVAPTPIPGGNEIGGILFHVTFFGVGVMPAVINNFNGFVGVAQVQGTGTNTNADGSTEPLLFDTDMRFMKGEYVGVDSKVHKGTFGFV